jgi:hypothetical protein
VVKNVMLKDTVDGDSPPFSRPLRSKPLFLVCAAGYSFRMILGVYPDFKSRTGERKLASPASLDRAPLVIHVLDRIEPVRWEIRYDQYPEDGNFLRYILGGNSASFMRFRSKLPTRPRGRRLQDRERAIHMTKRE